MTQPASPAFTAASKVLEAVRARRQRLSSPMDALNGLLDDWEARNPEAAKLVPWRAGREAWKAAGRPRPHWIEALLWSETHNGAHAAPPIKVGEIKKDLLCLHQRGEHPKRKLIVPFVEGIDTKCGQRRLSRSVFFRGKRMYTLELVALIAFPYFFISLRRISPYDIRVIFYFYSLSFVISSLVYCWAYRAGFITPDITLHEAGKGHILGVIFDDATDIRTDILAAAILFAVLLIPQSMNIVFCGLFGCAGSVWFFEWGCKFVAWTITKSYAIIAGIFSPLIVAAILTAQWKYAFVSFFTSQFFLMGAAAIILTYRKISSSFKGLTKDFPASKLDFQMWDLWVWATRHNESTG